MYRGYVCLPRHGHAVSHSEDLSLSENLDGRIGSARCFCSRMLSSLARLGPALVPSQSGAVLTGCRAAVNKVRRLGSPSRFATSDPAEEPCPRALARGIVSKGASRTVWENIKAAAEEQVSLQSWRSGDLQEFNVDNVVSCTLLKPGTNPIQDVALSKCLPALARCSFTTRSWSMQVSLAVSRTASAAS